MAIAAQDILQRVLTTLQDEDHVHWSIAELVRYFIDGQREIANVRPDAQLTAASVSLSAGARQTLPAGGKELTALSHNTGDGSGVTVVDRAVLDATVPGWVGGKQVTSVKHYMYDPREPRVFWVYPPAKVGASVFATYAAEPTDITVPAANANLSDVSGTMSLASWCANALQDYILMRAFLKEGEATANMSRAQAHQALVSQAIGAEFKSRLLVSPHAAAPAA